MAGAFSNTGTLTTLRENSLKRDNFNIFVGDANFKTNFFLMFKSNHTKFMYHNQLVNFNHYSLRCLFGLLLVAAIIFLEWSYLSWSLNSLSLLLAMALCTGASFYGTLKHAL